MLDESLLDAPEALARVDRRGLLRDAAGAGARVRGALRCAAEAGVTGLDPQGRPRSVMVAGRGGAASAVADLVGALVGGGAPVTRLRPTGVAPAGGALRWALPGWTGAVDLLLIVSTDGGEPGLAVLAEQAYRRGATVVAVAPTGSPLTETVDASRGLLVPLAPDPNQHHGETRADGENTAGPGVLWALVTPLLVLLDRIGLIESSDGRPRAGAFDGLADRLDHVAERCGPAVATYGNPAKTLASELAESLPLIWTEGTLAAPVGRRFAAVLAELTGRPALAAELPEALLAHDALLRGSFAAGAGTDDFFRDRVDDPPTLHARVVLLRDRPVGGLSAAPAAREAVHGHDTPLSELEPEEGTEIDALAELVAVTDFAAAYLALATTAAPA